MLVGGGKTLEQKHRSNSKSVGPWVPYTHSYTHVYSHRKPTHGSSAHGPVLLVYVTYMDWVKCFTGQFCWYVLLTYSRIVAERTQVSIHFQDTKLLLGIGVPFLGKPFEFVQ